MERTSMLGYTVVYKYRVYHCIEIMEIRFKEELVEKGYDKPEFIGVLVIDGDNQLSILRDEALRFQFMRENTVEGKKV